MNDAHTDWDVADNDTRPAIATLHTGGGGYWSNIKRDVHITELTVPYINEEGDFGELRVHFNTDSWRVDKVGLIYTDKQFMIELQAWLLSMGLAGLDVEYSEQGMQGDNYVSCDVEAEFLKTWKVAHPEAYKAAYDNIWAD
jgi:hypothetical protein